jgi:hypothetical protein
LKIAKGKQKVAKLSNSFIASILFLSVIYGSRDMSSNVQDSMVALILLEDDRLILLLAKNLFNIFGSKTAKDYQANDFAITVISTSIRSMDAKSAHCKLSSTNTRGLKNVATNWINLQKA